ncbi:MAG: elongation factor 4 [Candidatus Lloydbacteria bacterium RIFOXYC12_FULL_46_25]|uniref:Elongation factor 4 n=1 Tax=Candidatus Lloydbacteria bacterium RIFOXYC12_FULL_46_25 TaxID=1798670 RepID=A0A1G2E0T7_9BACT|nr:MAG: elongation factor 4 [Candidatus Lloydbacteria bacterium RIFOXYC12_FULL_46_25]
MNRQHIRNFSIIAHIDHGKSTLADRMLEITHTIEKRKMHEQVLDSMELERERGITIKMQPVRMTHHHNGEEYLLNLIDTPGHIDFSYEVSRALKAVEGTLLLVDATQGVQAQTLTTLQMAREHGLTIIPVLSKIDSPLARVDDVREEIVTLLGVLPEEVMLVSGKTGEGVAELLGAIVDRIPAPEEEFVDTKSARALIFDFSYSNHRGVILYVRVLDGVVPKGAELIFSATKEKFFAIETGYFAPGDVPKPELIAGEIGYIVTGIKRPGVASVGDTVTLAKNQLPVLPGYAKPRPVVWASVFPESQDDLAVLRQSLERLQLSDSSLSFEEEASGILGRGFRCGFLGMLHLEIITERLRREFDLNLIVTTPTITYEVTYSRTKKTETIYSPALFPDDGLTSSVREPWIDGAIITPPDYMGGITQLLYEHEAEMGDTDIFGDNRYKLEFKMPLRELMRGFFDKLKSVSSGFGSLSYELAGYRDADVVRLDILVSGDVVPAFSRVLSRRRVQEDAEAAVEKLYKNLPRQLTVLKIQAKSMGRIISSRTISALRKDVTGYLYGGDITRKMKLLEKQKKGKKKMQEARGKITIPPDVFIKMIRPDE